MSQISRRTAFIRRLERKNARRFVAQIRRATGMSIEGFCSRFKADVCIFRSWEAGAAIPPSHALAFLKVILRNPDFVDEALSQPGPFLVFTPEPAHSP